MRMWTQSGYCLMQHACSFNSSSRMSTFLVDSCGYPFYQHPNPNQKSATPGDGTTWFGPFLASRFAWCQTHPTKQRKRTRRSTVPPGGLPALSFRRQYCVLRQASWPRNCMTLIAAIFPKPNHAPGEDLKRAEKYQKFTCKPPLPLL